MYYMGTWTLSVQGLAFGGFSDRGVAGVVVFRAEGFLVLEFGV